MQLRMSALCQKRMWLLQDLVGFLSELHALHIDLFLHQQGLDTTTPAGKANGLYTVTTLGSDRKRVGASGQGSPVAGCTQRRPSQNPQLETSLRDQGSGTSSAGKVFMSLGNAT